MPPVVKNLIFDVGFHSGEDTDFYLRKGFSVVGIEAAPDLVANALIRFQDAIARGRLHVISGAIAPASAGKEVIFYANPDNPIWGTIMEDHSSRNEMLGYSSERIKVPRVDIAEIYRSYGIPFYLKIDVEGADRLILRRTKIVRRATAIRIGGIGEGTIRSASERNGNSQKSWVQEVQSRAAGKHSRYHFKDTYT